MNESIMQTFGRNRMQAAWNPPLPFLVRLILRSALCIPHSKSASWNSRSLLTRPLSFTEVTERSPARVKSLFLTIFRSRVCACLHLLARGCAPLRGVWRRVPACPKNRPAPCAILPVMKKKSKIESPRIASVNPSSLRRAKSRKVRLQREPIEPANPAFQGFSFSLIPSSLASWRLGASPGFPSCMIQQKLQHRFASAKQTCSM